MPRLVLWRVRWECCMTWIFGREGPNFARLVFSSVIAGGLFDLSGACTGREAQARPAQALSDIMCGPGKLRVRGHFTT